MSTESKPRLVRTADPDKIAAAIAGGKYRDDIPFYQRDEAEPAAALWIDTANKPGVAQ